MYAVLRGRSSAWELSVQKSIKPLTLLVGLCFAPFSYAEDIQDEAILVNSTRIAYADTEATYASEIHTRKMIEQSGAQTLVDYLGQHTSVNAAPYYGNRFTPALDMRGYGTEAGFQSIVVTVDGQRLNNIDLAPQLLGAIPLSNIDHIEITKGSGSVMQGDGAMAGTIQIVTRGYNGASIGLSTGSHGMQTLEAAAGIKRETYEISANATNASYGGISEADPTGHKDASTFRSEQARLGIRPLEQLWLNLDLDSSYVDTRYPNPLTLSQFNSNPAQSGGTAYSHQLFTSDRWKLGGEWSFSDQTKLTLSHSREDKRSEFISYASIYDYDYDTTDMAVVHKGNQFDLSTGLQAFNGTRTGNDDTGQTKKNNQAYFVQGAYHMGDTTLSAGFRNEHVQYDHRAPTGGNQLSKNVSLNAWDLGLNQRLDGKYSLFANLNSAFQAPDIDRFFKFVSGFSGPMMFNGFIEPAKAKTLTLGLNRVAPGNRFKLSVFRTNLDNEIYLDPFSYTNTNIDQSHKYGLEIQQYWKASSQLALNANYSYIRAYIDREGQNSGAYNGKELPGVPHHNLNLSGTYAFTDRAELTVSQVWRSSSYAIGDFANDQTQRQAAFNSTNAAFRYRQGTMEYFAAVQNLLNHRNGLWTANDSIYPVNFTRTATIGLKAKF